ncbi:PP2C family protein-serine/threonine phosphatase [Streptomyces echinoruber]|uniref:PP2C family protein-serine/threonine phosphatase n=1 Tax=Streptomyces echinoruber TaxID=68898 RepID=UPI003612DD80
MTPPTATPPRPAATGLVRHTLWTAAQQDSDPRPRPAALPSVHRGPRREKSPYRTLVHAVLDPAAAPVRLRVACAGHPAPLLRRRDGQTVLLEEHGPFLGVFDGVDHPVRTTPLHPGDSLVLYTDGFTEGSGSHLSREPEVLAALLGSWPGPAGDRPADETAGMLLTDAVTRRRGRLRDDLALLVVGAPGRHPPPRPAAGRGWGGPRARR